MNSDRLLVTSDVRRDLLASAALFRTEAAVVWEYVANSLQYVDRGVAPNVSVEIKQSPKEILISDNGRGMSTEDLVHFFTMHGENLDRREGRPGRGKFGTGKSAAFGIAREMVVATVKSGRMNRIRLTREMIDLGTSQSIEPEWEVRDRSTDEPNGTQILIRQIVLPTIRTSTVIDYIERNLQSWRSATPRVAVNSHLCEYQSPPIAETYRFEVPEGLLKLLGRTTLEIHVARAPLAESEQGIAITTGVGALVAVERAGIERKEFGNYLFGAIEVPNLESHPSDLEPYDLSRNLSLNPSHPVAQAILQFVGPRLEEVREKLLARAREVRRTEIARKLEQEAEKIATILNNDFRTVQEQLSNIRAQAASGPIRGRQSESGAQTDASPTSWVAGMQTPGTIERSDGTRTGGGKHRPAPSIPKAGAPDTAGNAAVDGRSPGEKSRKPAGGGFQVSYQHLGEAGDRSKYDPTMLRILINLDHPSIKAALGEGRTESPTFRRLSYEVAFSEYSVALAYETTREDPNIPADEVLYELRRALNRVSRAAASLYSD